MVLSVASTMSPMAARSAMPPSVANGRCSIISQVAGPVAVGSPVPLALPPLRGCSASSVITHALPVERRPALADEIGDQSCRAVRHRPAHVAVAGVEPEIGDRASGRRSAPPSASSAATPPSSWHARSRAAWPNNSRARALITAKSRRPVGGLVAADFGGRGQPQAVPHRAIGEQVLLVDAAEADHLRRVGHRHRHRVALDRIDRQADSKTADAAAASGRRAPAHRRRR